MHNVNIAEWILALITTRDRAASTVGDLTEGAATRGSVWFWSCIVRTASSLLWRDIAAHYARLAGLAILGLVAYIAISFVFACLSGIAFFVVAMATGHSLQVGTFEWMLWTNTPALVSSLLIGRMLARWAPGRELAAGLVYAILTAIFNLVPLLGNNGALTALLCILIVPVGAAWGRARRLRTT
jgi:hypothetical protein